MASDLVGATTDASRAALSVVLEWPAGSLEAAGAEEVPYSRGPRFGEVNLLIDAVIQGQGVALAGSISVNDAIHAGQLIKPFNLTFPLSFAFYLVFDESREGDRKIAAFREWMLSTISGE